MMKSPIKSPILSKGDVAAASPTRNKSPPASPRRIKPRLSDASTTPMSMR
jgi:hypothetical protein